MTLNDILISSLTQLGRGHDAMTIEAYRDRLTLYANDAQHDLAEAMGLFRTDTLTPSEGIIDVTALPRGCRKVICVCQLGHEVPFNSGKDSNTILLPYDTDAEITYEYEPKRLENPADVSEIDEGLHGLMVSYVVGRERMAGDVSTQRGSNLYLAMYESAKAKIRKHKGGRNSYVITNRYQ